MKIGLCGYKQSGKSTVAEYLRTNHGFTRVNFKDGLKLFMVKTLPDVMSWCRGRYNMTNEELFDNKPPLFRFLMQNIGTDLIRKEVADDFWVNLWRTTVDNLPVNVVADDVRFQNEADAVKMKGGIIIRVVMEGLETNDLHVSETEHLKIEEDFTITATRGDHAGVYAQVDEILNIIRNNTD